MDFTQTALPVTAPIGGYGMGGGVGWGAGIAGLVVGALLSGNGLGLGGGGLNTAINASQSGQIAGLEAAVSNIQNTLTTDSVTNQISTLSTNLLNSNLLLNNALDNNAREILAGQGVINTNLANGNFTTLSSINGLGRDVTAQNNQNALFNLNSFNQMNTAMLQGFNEVGRDQATATNQLIAGQSAAAAQLSSCCCDIKQAIMVDGNATRGLINDLNVQRLTSELNDAKNNISNSNQTNALIAAMAAQTNTIISHLIPFRTSSGGVVV